MGRRNVREINNQRYHNGNYFYMSKLGRRELQYQGFFFHKSILLEK